MLFQLRPTRLALLAVALAGMLCAPALGAEVTGDPGHSSAQFAVTHLAISTVTGTVPIVSWSATTGEDFIPTSLSATLDAKGIDSKNPDRDSELRGSAWFNTDAHPTFTFKSTKIVPGPDKTFAATGDLTMNGITKSVTLQGKLSGVIPDRSGGKRVGYSATTTIDRRQFGLNFDRQAPGGNLVVAYPVTLTLQAEGVAKG